MPLLTDSSEWKRYEVYVIFSIQMFPLYEIFLSHPIVTTDTRDCPAGSIFFALKGETFNGNEFAAQALEKGCAYAVIDDARFCPKDDDRYILVSDVLSTMQQLATFHRRQLVTPILQVTGTNGKTTTKELCAAVLSQKYNVLYTQGNLNNHIGVPKTLLRLTPQHDIAVIETGANHPGEIAMLSDIVDADCGLITNVGKAHLEGFGSFEGVVRTKGELYDHLRRSAEERRNTHRQQPFIFLDADNPHLQAIAEGLPSYTYGHIGGGAYVEGEVSACDPFVSVRWRSGESGDNIFEVHTKLIGAYNLPNILAAVSVGLRFTVSPQQICAALEEYAPTNSRSELRTTEHNRLIVDAYNANPTSMAAALDNFRIIPHAHKMLVLGAMRELGEASEGEHMKIARQAADIGAEAVWFVGEEFRAAAEAEHFEWFPDVEAVKQYLQDNPIKDRLILVKGSNSTRLWQLPECL